MKKGVTLIAAACCATSMLYAQQPADSVNVLTDDNADFTFTESQLDEDNDAAQTVASLSSSKSDLYLSDVGYLFSPMRFKVRAYDNAYNQVYMNGLLLNDAELGRFSYGMIGGMNEATRNKESVSGFEPNTFAFTPVGGATSINSRATAFAQGSKLTLSACNRNYLARAMFTHSTGLMDNGWALAGTVGYRWANEGVIDGTFYNSLSYFLAAEKKIDDRHSLSLVTFGSPTERAQQTAATEEVYWLANSHYYNSNWGYQNGEKRNARVVNDFEPTAILTWDFGINEKMKLVTSAGFKYSMYSTSALGWGGDAYDPRPDYYKNLPSSVFDVWDPNKNNPDYLAENPYLLEQYNTLVDHWTSSEANRQINWDRMYYVNRQSELNGGEALYYQERRHNDQMVISLGSTLNHNINDTHKYALGLQLNTTKGMHYKTMEDLLGGTRYTDIDKFAANDYGPGSLEAQNDLNNPNRMISEGDKFGYNYNIHVNKARLWGQYRYDKARFGLTVTGHMEGTSIERDGLMRNGRAPMNSYGKSGKAGFLGGGGKAIFNYRPAANHRITLAAGFDAAAPLARNAFVAARMQNNFVDNLRLENITSAELSYAFRFGNFSGKVSGFYSRFDNGVEQTAFYNDQEERFTYLTMSDVSKQHYGLEAAFVYQITSELSVKLLGTISEAEYINNPYAQLNYEGMDAKTIKQLNVWKNPVTGAEMPLRVIADGIHLSGTPLAAVSLGVDYNVNGWFFSANLNYYDKVYVGFSQYRRLSNVIGNYVAGGIGPDGNLAFDVSKAELNEYGGVLFNPEGQVVDTYTAEQEKFDGGFMLDASIGKYIRLKKGRSLSINLSLNNITNNTNMRTGGYEQNRDDYYNTGVARSYRFSKNNRYYYAYAFNAFLNVGYRF